MQCRRSARIAQAAQNANFAAQASKREETIEATTHATGNKVKAKTREDKSGGKQSADQHAHQRQAVNDAGEGLHFIDVTA